MRSQFCLFLFLGCIAVHAVPGRWMTQQEISRVAMADNREVSRTKFSSTNALPDAPSPSHAASPAAPTTTVVVSGTLAATDRDSTPPQHASSEEILSSAGTYGDLSRYLQTFPGVVFNTDESDDVLVRGGNPLENLYLVDGIEVPNINHIAMEASTGGLVSMIDTASIEGIDLYTDGYDASYENRLSSVVDIHTRTAGERRHTEGDVGFIGAGLITESPISGGNGSSWLLAAHRSLLNLFTHDIGLGGVPIYSNGLLSATLKQSDASELHLLSLGGVDSISITPTAADLWETNTIQTQYNGWRFTNGMRWKLQPSTTSISTFTLSDSEQHEEIAQQDQYFQQVSSYLKDVVTPVYSERTYDGISTFKYDGIFFPSQRAGILAGGGIHLYRVNYDVAQPQGQQSPLSTDPTRSDAVSFSPRFVTAEPFWYAQVSWHLSDRWSVSGGGRMEMFPREGASSVTPRLNSIFRLSEHQNIHASFGEYKQLPPFIYIESYPQNHALRMIAARHFSIGGDLYRGARVELGMEIYRKAYRSYPVSTEYPALSLANMVDTLGQQILWIPLISKGTGISEGIEFSGRWRPARNFWLMANASYARARYAALDGVLRPGNFDYPVVLNMAGSYHPDPRYELTWRYEYTTGRPYTPFLLDESAAQDRPIYDISRVNGVRGPYYERLDFQLNRSFGIGSHHFITYVGFENAFNRGNLLGYFWMPRIGHSGRCATDLGWCISKQDQMGRFPNFGARYVF